MLEEAVGEELPTDLHWMQLQVGTLFRHDARGRLVGTREPDAVPPPHFFLGRTGHGNLWRLAADLPDEAVRELARLAGREPGLPAADGRGAPPPPERAEPLRRVLLAAGLAPLSAWSGPAFRFPARLPPAPAAARATRVVELGPEDDACLALHFPWLPAEREGRAPAVAVVEDGVAVAVCHAARGGGAFRRAATGAEAPRGLEAGVETAPEQRRRGHARRAVLAWAARVRERGAVPLYSTAWTNRASRGLAGSLGLVLYGEDWHLTGARP